MTGWRTNTRLGETYDYGLRHVRALSTPAYAVTGSWSSHTIPGSYLRSHYPKSRAKSTQTTAYSTARFTSHLRVEYNNYNKPGQETILDQQSEFTCTCTESQYIQVISILKSEYCSLINKQWLLYTQLSLSFIILQLFSFPATSSFMIISWLLWLPDR